jgi:hypothetical protein
MKGKTRFALLAVLLAVLIAGFAGEAAARPKWLGTKLKWNAKIGNPAGLEGDWTLSVTIENDSDDRIVTQLSEMKGSATFTVTWYNGQNHGSKPDNKTTKTLNFSSNKAYKVELTPGESKTYTWKIHNQLSRYMGYDAKCKLEKWSFDCSAKSRKEKR